MLSNDVNRVILNGDVRGHISAAHFHDSTPTKQLMQTVTVSQREQEVRQLLLTIIWVKLTAVTPFTGSGRRAWVLPSFHHVHRQRPFMLIQIEYKHSSSALPD